MAADSENFVILTCDVSIESQNVTGRHTQRDTDAFAIAETELLHSNADALQKCLHRACAQFRRLEEYRLYWNTILTDVTGFCVPACYIYLNLVSGEIIT